MFKIYCVGFVIIILLEFSGCGTDGRKQEREIARIGETKLVCEDLIRKVPPEFAGFITKKQWLDLVQSWLDEQLLAKYAYNQGADKDDDVLRKLEEARRKILTEYLRDKIIAPKIEVTDEEIERYYLEHQGNFVRENEELNALHIVVSEKQDADTVKALLEQDSSFCGLARIYSEEYSPTDSCNIGWFSRADLIPELVRPVFDSKPGEIIGPVKADNNYHFFYILDYGDAGTVRSLEQVKDEIHQHIFTAKFNDYMNNILDSLRASVEIYVDTSAIDSLVISNSRAKSITDVKTEPDTMK